VTPGVASVVRVERRIAAPAPAIFAILSDPRRHTEIDGSGMLRGDDDARPITGVGDEFFMTMYYEQFGDYVMRNLVVEFVIPERIVWEPTRHDIPHDEVWHIRWGYELTPDGSDATVVTAVYDCRTAPATMRSSMREGEHWRPAMEETLDRLARVAAGA
jgi:hypothetical protein